MADIKTLKSLAADLNILYVEDEQEIREEVSDYLRRLSDLL